MTLTFHEKYIKALDEFKPEFGNFDHTKAVKIIGEVSKNDHYEIDSPRIEKLKEDFVRISKPSPRKPAKKKKVVGKRKKK